MPFHQIGDAKINYEVIENCLPQNTFFIHGNLASNRWWYPAAEVWKKNNKNKNLSGSMILAEFRGCGKSTPLKNPADISMELFASDFISLVRSLNLTPMNLVGHSTGGYIAALMLSKAANLFSKAIFLDPVGARGVKFDDALTGAFEAMKADKELTATVMASTIYNNDSKSDFFRQVVVEDAFHAVNTVGGGVLKALDGANISDQIKTVMTPTKVLHGEHDFLLPIEDSKEMASLLKNGQFEVIKNQGHCTNVENPTSFVQLVDGFLFT